MIKQNVQVVRCHDNSMWVRMGSQTGCEACDNGNGCGAGVFAKLLRNKPVVIEIARNDMPVEPGQMVILSFPEEVYIKLIAASYGWPLLAALLGAFAGYTLGTWLQIGPALIDMATLLFGLLAAWLVIRLVKKQTNAGTILSSLHTTLYYPSTTPHMCSSETKP